MDNWHSQKSLLLVPVRDFPADRDLRRKLQLWQLFLAMALAALSWNLFTLGNDFPLSFHTDEYMKIHQVQSHMDLFFHPLLLLSTVRSLSFWAPGDVDHLVWLGRSSSAAAGVLAVIFAYLFGCRLRGLAGGLLAGLFTALLPQLVIASHAIKEDSFLAAGLLGTLWAIAAYADRRDLPAAAVLGMMAALAISAKYVGAISTITAVGSLAVFTIQDWRTGERVSLASLKIAAFLVSLLAAVVIINLPLFLDWQGFREGINTEVQHVTSGHRGLEPVSPALSLLRNFLEASDPFVLMLAATGILLMILRRSWNTTTVTLLLAAGLYIAIIAVSKARLPHYLLPAALCFCVLAALGALDLARQPGRSRRFFVSAALALTLLALGLETRNTVRVSTQILHDTRYATREWISVNLPIDARIMQDKTVGLPPNLTRPSGEPFPHPVVFQSYFSDYPSLEDLVRNGVQYYVASSQVYGRYENPHLQLRITNHPVANAQIAFYNSLAEHAELIAQKKPRGRQVASWISPEIRIYRMPDNLPEAPADPGHPDTN